MDTKKNLKDVVEKVDIIDRAFIKHIQSNKKNVKCPRCGEIKSHSAVICSCEFGQNLNNDF